MNILAMKPLTIAKLGLCAVVLAVAALGLGREGHPANATDPTRILMTPANFAPIEVTGIILFPDGPGMELTFWVKNAVSTLGAGSFSVGIAYDSSVLHVNSVADGDADDGMTVDGEWLSANQTQVVACTAPFIRNNIASGQGEAEMGCSILGVPSLPPAKPWGALGDGVLGTIYVTPGSTKVITELTMDNTWLADTGEQVDVNGDTIFDLLDKLHEPAIIPAKVLSMPVSIITCADFTSATPGVPDGVVTIIDLLYVASFFVSNYTHPDWNPDYDMNLDRYITIPDILIAARQFGTVCP